MEHIGVRETINLCGLTFNVETILMTWLSMFVVIVFTGLAVRRLKVVPTGCQNCLEIVISWLQSQASAMMGARSKLFEPLIVALFLFLLSSNLLGLIPFLESPTNDLNTTLGMALLIVTIVHISDLYFHGSHYIAHFFKPFPSLNFYFTTGHRPIRRQSYLHHSYPFCCS